MMVKQHLQSGHESDQGQPGVLIQRREAGACTLCTHFLSWWHINIQQRNSLEADSFWLLYFVWSLLESHAYLQVWKLCPSLVGGSSQHPPNPDNPWAHCEDELSEPTALSVSHLPRTAGPPPPQTVIKKKICARSCSRTKAALWRIKPDQVGGLGYN